MYIDILIPSMPEKKIHTQHEKNEEEISTSQNSFLCLVGTQVILLFLFIYFSNFQI